MANLCDQNCLGVVWSNLTYVTKQPHSCHYISIQIGAWKSHLTIKKIKNQTKTVLTFVYMQDPTAHRKHSSQLILKNNFWGPLIFGSFVQMSGCHGKKK